MRSCQGGLVKVKVMETGKKTRVSTMRSKPQTDPRTDLGNGSRRVALRWLALLPWLPLGACGYRLRGIVALPYSAVAITGSPSPLLRTDLERAILTGTDAKVAVNPKDAELVIDILGETYGREILAYNANGQVSAYRLNVQVAFRAYDTAGEDVVPESTLYITRDMDFSVSTVLATDAQTVAFVGLMRADLVVQLLRRVSSESNRPASSKRF